MRPSYIWNRSPQNSLMTHAIMSRAIIGIKVKPDSNQTVLLTKVILYIWAAWSVEVILTLTLSMGYMTQCSMIPAAAPATIWAVRVLLPERASYSASPSIVTILNTSNKKIEITHKTYAFYLLIETQSDRHFDEITHKRRSKVKPPSPMCEPYSCWTMYLTKDQLEM